MVGSDAPLISDDAPASNGAPPAPVTSPLQPVRTATGEIDPATWVMTALMPAVRARTAASIAAFLNGSCHVVSWQDGILTLGFYQEFHRGKTETVARKEVEDAAAELLGAPVSLRCIIAAKPAKPLSKSPLVQHAVENRGATIVSPE